jgi:ATP-dependent DNA helicase RecG
MLPNGQWKLIKDIKVGDVIMAWDGTSTTVTGVYPQGMQDDYLIKFVDGRTANAGPEHLWSVWDAGKGRRGKWRTLDTLAVQERMLELRNSNAKNHLSIPLIEPDKVSTPKRFKIHPYVIGVLIGDGTISGGTLGYCKPDDNLLARMKRFLPAGYSCKYKDEKHVSIFKTEDYDPSKHIDMRQERRKLIKAYGATLVLTPGAEGMKALLPKLPAA